MGAFPPPTPMLPPEVRGQMAGPPAPAPEPVMLQASRAMIPQMVDPVAILEGKLKELELWTSDMLPLVSRIHPPLKALLVPLANIGQQFQSEIGRLRERSAQLSPQAGVEATAPAMAGMPPCCFASSAWSMACR